MPASFFPSRPASGSGLLEPRRDAPPPLAQLAQCLADRSALIGVVGLGYVGLPLLVEAGQEGFGVIGIDSDATRVQALRGGCSYLVDVDDADVASITRSQFSIDHRVLVAADAILIAVPTPLREGRPDLSQVCMAAHQVAEVLRPGQLVVLESTTYPGTTEDVLRPILEQGGLVAGRDFALAYSPERIDPGTRHHMRTTPKVVAGTSPAETDLAVALYSGLVDEVVRTSSPREAEMAKLIENTFRQVNIALVNELATIAPAIGVDIWAALEAAATKPFGYLPFWPGAGVGGHCIAIDPSYLSWQVEQRLGFGIGFIEHARSVNNRMPAYVTSRVAGALNDAGLALRGTRLLVIGLTYKPGVEDVRESPALAVLQQLVDAGAECTYHDPYVPEVRVGETVLTSMPLDAATVAEADGAVILTAHPEIHYDTVLGAPLVFDASGVTRDRRAEHVVLL